MRISSDDAQRLALFRRTLRTRNLAGAAALICAGVAALAVVRRGRRRRGLKPFSSSVRAEPFERTRFLPGDQLIRQPARNLTHAITIRRPPSRVWPWLAQMGAGRAGWYSYDVLDNGRQPSANEIVPALQQIDVGDVMPALPGVTDGFTVLEVAPGHHLLAGWLLPDRTPIVTWAFVLEPAADGGTRLIVRVRTGPRDDFLGMPAWIGRLAIRPIHFIMQRKQLLGLARRAERFA